MEILFGEGRRRTDAKKPQALDEAAAAGGRVVCRRRCREEWIGQETAFFLRTYSLYVIEENWIRARRNSGARGAAIPRRSRLEFSCSASGQLAGCHQLLKLFGVRAIPALLPVLHGPP